MKLCKLFWTAFVAIGVNCIFFGMWFSMVAFLLGFFTMRAMTCDGPKFVSKRNI